MKRTKCWSLLLAGEAVLCLAAGSLLGEVSLYPAACWPVLPLGQLLRGLSLAGNGGNIAAWVLFLLLGLAPVILAGIALLRKRRLHAEDWAGAVLLSGLLLWSLYAAVNPQCLDHEIASSQLRTMHLTQLNMTCLSVLLGWGVLRTVRALRTKDVSGLLRALRPALPVIAVFAVAECCLLTLPGVLLAVRGAQEGLTGCMLLLRGLSDALPQVLLTLLMIRTGDLLHTLDSGRPTQATSQAAAGLSKFCGRSMVAVASAQTAVNVLQAVLLPRLSDSAVSVSLPIFSLLLMLLVLCLCALLRKNQQLGDENDLFV